MGCASDAAIAVGAPASSDIASARARSLERMDTSGVGTGDVAQSCAGLSAAKLACVKPHPFLTGFLPRRRRV
jgi:hypothetical protein